MEELIKEFLSFLLEKRGATGNTISAYRLDLEQFAQFCSLKNKSFSQLDQELINDFLNWLEQKSYAQTSLNRKLAALRSFSNWLELGGKIAPVLTAEEIEKLLEITASSPQPIAIRNLAIIELFFRAGLRVSELVNLDVQMLKLDPENPRIQISEEREIPLPQRTTEVLSQYLEKVRPSLSASQEEKALFLNQKRRERLTRFGIWVILKKYGRKAGLKITPQVLRYSFAARG